MPQQLGQFWSLETHISQHSLSYPFLGNQTIRMYTNIWVILRDFHCNHALFGLVSYHDPLYPQNVTTMTNKNSGYTKSKLHTTNPNRPFYVSWKMGNTHSWRLFEVKHLWSPGGKASGATIPGMTWWVIQALWRWWRCAFFVVNQGKLWENKHLQFDGYSFLLNGSRG